ncbi:hypothetical protein DB43_FQ00080 [Parachlamydia acanthamoebae]|uniref:Uncharacterized protein n=1 Tax=Parachlamydia acanthamoebae TaxID=83552 RepID=A0A0C1E9G3_9BACT|nr:hypothetical protein DB43_FQ00080 [Parachlamydia acanthamoebae]
MGLKRIAHLIFLCDNCEDYDIEKKSLILNLLIAKNVTTISSSA